MAFRTWGKLLLSALGIGALVGAGQLGFAYGLDIVRFARTFDAAAASRWTAQLTWVTWFAMVAAVVGAVAGQRLARRHGHSTAGVGIRWPLAGAAALGATAVAPLCMLPARAAQVASANPVLVTGLSAALGAVLGGFASVAVLTHRAIGWNVAATTGGVWLLALVSVAPSLGPTDPLPAVRLGVLDPAWLSAGSAQRLAFLTMPALALVAGAATGALARRRGHPVLAVAACGGVGPAMLALAYLTAGPAGADDGYQAAPYWAALLASGAGALGSVLATVVRWPASAGADEETPDPEASGGRHPVEPARAGEGRNPEARNTTSGDTGVAEGTGGPDAGGPKAGGPKAGGPKARQPKAGGPKAGGPKAGGPKAGGPKAGGPKAGGPKAGGPKAGGPKAGGPKAPVARNPDIPRQRRSTDDGGAADPGTGGRTQRGLFRRNRPAKMTGSGSGSGSAGEAGPPSAESAGQRPAGDRDAVPDGRDPAVPARDEEYVDWVSGLATGRKTGPGDPSERRSRRPGGRHHGA